MKQTATMSRYLAGLFSFNFMAILGILLTVSYLFGTLELLRMAAKVNTVGFSDVVTMGFYKLPDIGQTILPFAILFGAMFTFWTLARRHELAVIRAAGFSVWQFLAPVLAVAALAGCLDFMVVNPVSAVLLARYDVLESKYFSHGKDVITMFDDGLWLRQLDRQDQGYMIVHANRIALPQWQMQGVMALFFDPDDGLVKRIDAKSALLNNGEWHFDSALVYQGDNPATAEPGLTLATDLTPHDIEESFSSARSQSFWKLPGYIRTLSETGFDATRLKIHFNALLAQPVLFMAMVLLAAAVSMRPPRFQRGLQMTIAGVVVGFLVFFMSSFLQALGASQQIPVILAAWAPATVCLLGGLAVILMLEDG